MASVVKPGVGPSREGSAMPQRRPGRMESLFNVAVFGLFALLWAGFGIALIASQGSLDGAWEWIRNLPLVLQGVVTLLFLPVVAGLWIWETTWPLVVRLVLVAGLAWVNLFTFFPRTLFGGQS